MYKKLKYLIKEDRKDFNEKSTYRGERIFSYNPSLVVLGSVGFLIPTTVGTLASVFLLKDKNIVTGAIFSLVAAVFSVGTLLPTRLIQNTANKITSKYYANKANKLEPILSAVEE